MDPRTSHKTPTPAVDAPPATRREDTVTVLIGAWLIAGLFSDGWAHHNVPELEGFFTPWHGVLYLGLVLAGAWFVRLGGGLHWYRRLPRGYGWGAVGLVVFAAGGVSDMAWHLAFGVEEGVDALLSPSHLVLLVGGLLILTSAVRSRWSTGDTHSAVAVAALTLVTALVSFFLLYVSEFVANAPTDAFHRLPEGHPRHAESELPATAGVAGFLLTTALLVVPLAWVWRRGRTPRGLLISLVGVTAWLSAAVLDLERTAVTGALGATLGAALAEVALARAEVRLPVSSPLRLPALAVIAVTPVWTVHIAALAVVVGLAWPVELWSGVVVLSALGAAALAALATPMPPSGAA